MVGMAMVPPLDMVVDLEAFKSPPFEPLRMADLKYVPLMTVVAGASVSQERKNTKEY